MKIRYNIPAINNIKNKINNVKNKIKNSNGKANIPKRNYALLLLMILLGVLTLSKNVSKYNEYNKEDYDKYELEENNIQVSNQSASVIYKIEESSIYTVEPSIETVQTISSSTTNSIIMPIDGNVIRDYAKDTLVYSKTLDMWKTHPGIDIQAPIGTDVVSVIDGEVVEITKHSFYGNCIKVSDINDYTYIYSNLADDIAIKQGDKVKQGQSIGKIGTSATGEIADQPHLHFEILKNSEHINPAELLSTQ